MDGAGSWPKFRVVTLPFLRPAMLPYAIYGFVITFNLFYLSYFMSGGGPFGQTELLVTTATGSSTSTPVRCRGRVRRVPVLHPARDHARHQPLAKATATLCGLTLERSASAQGWPVHDRPVSPGLRQRRCGAASPVATTVPATVASGRRSSSSSLCLAIVHRASSRSCGSSRMALDPRNLSRPDGLIPPGASLDAFARVLARPTRNPVSLLAAGSEQPPPRGPRSRTVSVGRRRARGLCVLADAASAAASS